MAGQFLSLNQGILLVFASRHGDVHPCRVSIIASLLKSLSPAGKRLTPMLAISVQGLLFSVGLFLGRNALGIAVGMALLSVWAFAQPLLLAHLIFGQALWAAIEKLWGELATFLSLPVEWGIRIILAAVVLKALLAVGLGLAAWWGGPAFETRYSNKLKSLPRIAPKAKSNLSPWKGALKDLLSPWFVLSLVLSGIYFWFSGKEIWLYLLRPLAVGWLVFWAIRSIPYLKQFRGNAHRDLFRTIIPDR